jgi:hypothetical protein
MSKTAKPCLSFLCAVMYDDGQYKTHVLHRESFEFIPGEGEVLEGAFHDQHSINRSGKTRYPTQAIQQRLLF